MKLMKLSTRSTHRSTRQAPSARWGLSIAASLCALWVGTAAAQAPAGPDARNEAQAQGERAYDPPGRIGAQVGPEQRDVIDMVIVAGQHGVAHFGGRADQENLVGPAARRHPPGRRACT